jgi:hypothetical protein
VLANPGPEGTARHPDGTTSRLVPQGPGILHVVDFSAKDKTVASPKQLATLELRAVAKAVAIDQQNPQRAYIADVTGGVSIVDLSDPAAPTLVSYFHTDGTADGIAVMNRRVILANGEDQGVVVLDVSDPQQPRFAERIPTSGLANTLARVGDHLILGDGTKALRAFAFDNADRLRLVASLTPAGVPADIAPGPNGTIWTADRTAGLVGYRISP